MRGGTAWVEGRWITVSSAAKLLEIQYGTGAPTTIEENRITVMARGI